MSSLSVNCGLYVKCPPYQHVFFTLTHGSIQIGVKFVKFNDHDFFGMRLQKSLNLSDSFSQSLE